MRVKALLNKSDLSTTPKCAMKISSPRSRAKLPKQVLGKQPEPGACRNQGLIRRFPTRFCWSFCLDMVSTFCFVADFFQHWGYVHLFQFRNWMPDLNISWHDQRPLNGNHPTNPECAVCTGSADCSELESVLVTTMTEGVLSSRYPGQDSFQVEVTEFKIRQSQTGKMAMEPLLRKVS